jgi:hypothetical protein
LLWLIAPKAAHLVQSLKNDRLKAIGQCPSLIIMKN